MDKLSYDGPIVLAVLDGVGLAPDGPGNAVSKARTAFLGNAARECPHIALEASGEAVGLIAGQMGNSEVGHNTMGAGRAIKQGIAEVEEAFATDRIFDSEAWKGAIEQVLMRDGFEPRTLHFAGIFSDGGVHSHISHLEQMVQRACMEGVRKIRVHAIFDGRDVPPQSEPKYIQRFETFTKKFLGEDVKIASGGGRMTTVADRYENDWSMVARGWDMMVNGEADYYFKSAEEAISILRRINPEVQDQDLPAFVIVDDDEKPIGKIEKGDALIYFDFRKDRAIEIAQAFTYWDFPYFNRGDYKPSDVYFAGMTEYNSDTHVPEHRLVQPVEINETLHRFLAERKISQLAVSETVKFGHITYYFDGNRYKQEPLEDFIEVKSYKDYAADRPWMRSADITDVVIKNMDKYKFIRLNFPNGDIVGHTANMEATVIGMEAVDLCLSRIAKKVDELKGVLVVVADHGKAEELLDEKGGKKTAHTTNKVPCIIYDNTKNKDKYRVAGLVDPSIASIAATVAVLLGQNDYPESWDKSLISVL